MALSWGLFNHNHTEFLQQTGREEYDSSLRYQGRIWAVLPPSTVLTQGLSPLSQICGMLRSNPVLVGRSPTHRHISLTPWWGKRSWRSGHVSLLGDQADPWLFPQGDETWGTVASSSVWRPVGAGTWEAWWGEPPWVREGLPPSKLPGRCFPSHPVTIKCLLLHGAD